MNNSSRKEIKMALKHMEKTTIPHKKIRKM